MVVVVVVMVVIIVSSDTLLPKDWKVQIPEMDSRDPVSYVEPPCRNGRQSQGCFKRELEDWTNAEALGVWSGKAVINLGPFSTTVLAPPLLGELLGWQCYQGGV